MPLYIALVTYTDRGMQAVRESPRRLDQAKAQLAEMGGRFQAVYMTMGAHDLVFVYEAPDDAIAARFTLGLGLLGNVRTTTMKAFPEGRLPRDHRLARLNVRPGQGRPGRNRTAPASRYPGHGRGTADGVTASSSLPCSGPAR